ncbi:MAG: DinB family protein [Planctomycetes bacterium]|nr:DinB family protein [Planctomycetota bacterium]
MGAQREAKVQKLKSDLKEVLGFFDQPEAVQNRAYAPGKWTMRELLIHLSDSETVILDRLRRLAAEDKPVLQAFDQDKWAAKLFYKSRDMKLAKQQYQAARETAIELLSTLDATFDANTGTHSETGPKTFGQIAEVVVTHTSHHLEQLRAIAAGKTWTKS